MINVENLSFRYKDKYVLNNINFTAQTGKVTAIIGANGTGKSTLLKNITGSLKGNGNILLNNKPINEYKNDEFTKIISYLSQNNDCRAVLNVFEVILLGRMNSLSFKVSDKDIEKVHEVMKQLGIEEFASRNIGELSGGQRQLVFIAQALVKEPDILILDEPTSALDLNHQFEMLELLKELTEKNNFTTLITLHHLDLAARFADEIIVINDGSLYDSGHPKKIFTEKMIKDVYHVKSRIYMDDNDVPHVIPLSSIGKMKKII
ncbi:ABC transporter ATP-binding protein [Terrisporobacter glycolicus]|uniref:Petrobactin import ATP-binding protein FpuD n=1 Tax=Terrisporobacter glycolicus ATCC 14880 = DSM 1288 TaxID=1121315 RepID=A0ABZ2EV08_9FIRM|nr:ABC transporter ATP-binding protein [Terrisporobacter glycolicus]